MLWYIIKGLPFYDRLNYYYYKYDFITFLLTRRNEILEEAWTTFLNNYNVFEKLFGKGRSGFTDEMATSIFHPSTVEIDPFDLLFYYGFVGLVVIYGFWLSLLKKSFVRRNEKYMRFAPVVFLINMLLIAMTLLSGHIIYSGMAGFHIGLANALLYTRNSQ
ncbi:hypothetical protein GCM10009122_20260 [Fulvivirga kasyanovii]